MYEPDKMKLPIYPHPPLNILNEPVNTTIYIYINQIWSQKSQNLSTKINFQYFSKIKDRFPKSVY